MQESRITVRGLTTEALDKLDRIVEQDNTYSSRSELICDIINKYLADKDSFVLNNLPAIVRSITEQELKKLSQSSTEIINDLYRACVRMIRISQKFENFLYPELSRSDMEDINTEQLISILDLMDND